MEIKLLVEFEQWFRKKYHAFNCRLIYITPSLTWEFFNPTPKENIYQKGKEPIRFCKICNNQITNKRRQYYCSDSCSAKASMFNWNHVKSLFNGLNDNYKCVFCGSDDTEIDHIRQIGNGGLEFDVNNLRYLCPTCNRGRSKPIPVSNDQTRLL